LEARWDALLPTEPGVHARGLFENGAEHPIKAVWLCRYDPATTATFCDVPATVGRLELVIAQHLFLTATAQLAHVVLPSVAFGEEQVTFTSADRRIQLANKVIEPPPGPIPTWQQLAMIGRALGAEWDYPSAAAVMDEIGEVVPFYGGANFDNLQRDYGRQWPCTKDRPLGTRFLFSEGPLDRRFRFAPVPKPSAPPDASPDYPLALVFGQSLYYWHQNILVKHSEMLRRELRVLLLDYPEGFVEMNQEDADSLSIRDGARIRLVSRLGSVVTTARVTHEVRGGTIVVPFFVREVERQILGANPAGLGTSSRPVFVRVEKL
jgi:formate dehydrogenase major subunit